MEAGVAGTISNEHQVVDPSFLLVYDIGCSDVLLLADTILGLEPGSEWVLLLTETRGSRYAHFAQNRPQINCGTCVLQCPHVGHTMLKTMCDMDDLSFVAFRWN